MWKKMATERKEISYIMCEVVVRRLLTVLWVLVSYSNCPMRKMFRRLSQLTSGVSGNGTIFWIHFKLRFKTITKWIQMNSNQRNPMKVLELRFYEFLDPIFILKSSTNFLGNYFFQQMNHFLSVRSKYPLNLIILVQQEQDHQKDFSLTKLLTIGIPIE